MKKVVADIGCGGQFVMNITEEEYRRGEFFMALPKVLTANWSENMEASSETTTKKMVFRKQGNEVFNLIGWE